MKIATIELKTDKPKSAILAATNKIETVRAETIKVEWKSQHVVLYIKYKKNMKNPVWTKETIAYRARDVLGLIITEEEDE